MTPPPSGALIGFLAWVVAQRLFELRVSATHTRTLVARGAREHGGGHFPLLVALHVAWPLALVAEVAWLGARPPALWPWLLATFLAAQALRFWAIHSLGGRWTVRLWTLPGEPAVIRGPYRWIPHPNYLAVAIELASAPLMFGAWRTALFATIVNAIALAIRIPIEERSLAEAAATRPATGRP